MIIVVYIIILDCVSFDVYYANVPMYSRSSTALETIQVLFRNLTLGYGSWHAQHVSTVLSPHKVYINSCSEHASLHPQVLNGSSTGM